MEKYDKIKDPYPKNLVQNLEGYFLYKDKISKKENDRYTLKSRMRLEQLMKTPIYVKSDIRLKFPNEIILQGSFALYETIGDIYNFIRIIS